VHLTQVLDFALVLLAIAEAWVIPFLPVSNVNGLGVIRIAAWLLGCFENIQKRAARMSDE